MQVSLEGGLPGEGEGGGKASAGFERQPHPRESFHQGLVWAAALYPVLFLGLSSPQG